MAHDAALTEPYEALCTALFAGLPRKDQRRRGAEYVHGLLHTPGRKSIRNIAGHANEQRLHHFVSDSTWDWTPVRRALRQHLLQVAPPQAWVIRPLVVAKSRRARPAVGVWAAAPGWAVPVGWRLHRPGDCLADAYLELFDGHHDRPVVVDARGTGATGLVRRLRAAGAPVLARVDPDTPVRAGARTPGHGEWPLPAARLFGAGGGPVAVCPARLAGPGREDELTLLGIRAGGPWPDEVWLTDLTGHPPAHLMRLRRLVEQVDADLAAIGDRVGLRDYSGRSYAGWHRHVTLASAAHALVALRQAG
ncbi:transposase [Dactylosporangium sp. NPDC051485]|uniref:transposase n=1 Tax=Dactylosporangium sp. NPDC051485 TaxID=3154846 RepID=UPI003415BD08